MRTYLVTGAAGLVGAETVSQLLAQGDTVVAVDNLNAYYDQRLKRYRLARLKALAEAPDADAATTLDPESVGEAFTAGRLTYQTLDLEDREAVTSLFAQYAFDGILNLAARAGVRYSMENPSIYFTTNVNGLLHLLEAMKDHGVTKLVQASTSSLYAGQEPPFTEELPVNRPISP